MRIHQDPSEVAAFEVNEREGGKRDYSLA